MKRIVFAMLLLLLFGGQVLAQSSQRLDIQQYVLDNGLEVILARDVSAPTIAVDVWYQVGAANDPEGRSGFAHLFEHMMFEGSPNLPEGGMGQLISAAGGIINAYTTIDVTAYYEALPSNQLPLALWLEADRMAGLPVTQVNLDNQRAVVIEELQLRVSNSPYGEAIQELYLMPYTYPPYQRRAIGSIEDINNAVVEDVKDFHRQYYLPNNATLVVAGDIDFEVTRALIDDLFAPIPIGDEPLPLPDYEPVEQDQAEILVVEDPLINLPAVFVAYEIPPFASDDYPALDLTARLLGVGASSRLSRKLLDTGQALQASTLIEGNRGPGLFGFILIPNVGADGQAVEQAVYDELQLILDEGIPQDELDKAIAQIQSGHILGLETAFGLAESVQKANYHFGDPQAVYSEIERYETVTSEDIQAAVGKYLEESDRHVIYVVPSQAAPPPPVEPFAIEDAVDEAPDYRYVIEQAEPPPALGVSEFTLPKITETVLDNGLEIVVIEQPNVPIISLDMVFAGGSSAAPEDLPGLAGMTGVLISRGTSEHSGQDLAGAIEQIGGALASSGGRDGLSVSVFAMIDDAEFAFELLSDMTLNADFPEAEVERQRQAAMGSLEASLAEPNLVAGRAFSQLLYGEHPYGMSVSFESLQAITRDDIVSFYQSRSQPDNAVLIIAGAITAEAGTALAETFFADWEGSAQAVSFPDLPPQPETRIYLIDRPGSTQAEFIIGGIGAKGDSLDSFPIQIMNEVLGGSFSSRLTQNIREDKGYTYRISSSFSFPADIGAFTVTAAVRNDVIDLAIKEVFKEIERVQNEPFTDEEFNNARDGIIGRFALGLETYQDFVETVSSYKIRGIELDRLGQWPRLMNEVTVEDVIEVANQYIQDDHFTITVVGDAAAIQEQLESIGPVTLLELE